MEATVYGYVIFLFVLIALCMLAAYVTGVRTYRYNHHLCGDIWMYNLTSAAIIAAGAVCWILVMAVFSLQGYRDFGYFFVGAIIPVAVACGGYYRQEAKRR